MPKYTKAERQYIKGIAHNYTLQRWSDQDIVDYLHNEKKIDLTKSMISKIRNQTEQDAQIWFKELQDSSHKTIAFYKERLDSLLSYQKKLNEIMSNCAAPEIGIRAIAELHRIEMSLHNLMQEFPQINIQTESLEPMGIDRGQCDCTPTHTITHSRCRACSQVWCPRTLKQDWCPNPDCWLGIKGSKSQPYDAQFDWIKCSKCDMWFMTPEILAVHHCWLKESRLDPRENPKFFMSEAANNDGCLPNGEPLVHQDQVMPKQIVPSKEEQPVIEVTGAESAQFPEETKTEEESEQDQYWSLHPKPKPRKDNDKQRFVIT